MRLRSIFFSVFAVALTTNPGFAQALENMCTEGEQVVWSCQAGEKALSLCASRDLNASEGYLQYRVGSKARIEFTHPAKKLHPSGVFTFALLPRAVSVSFENEVYGYRIIEPLAGKTKVEVNKGTHTISSLECREATESLTLTSTLNQFKAVGTFK